MANVDIVNADDVRQELLPIARQRRAKELAHKSVRLLNCWLGVATKEGIGNTFCVECEHLQDCKRLYRFFDGATGLHPAARARDIFKRFGIKSEYL